MPIKMIAVDMDGTFLNGEKTYNRPRFSEQYQRIKQKGIRFVVASGNQYYQLASFFPEIAHEISFVADNGAWVISEGQALFNGELTREEFLKVIDYLQAHPYIDTIVSGKRSGYVLDAANEPFKQLAAKYYHRLEHVQQYADIDDCVFKFALNVDDALLDETMADIDRTLAGIVTPVTSGHGSIDLIIPGLHKANGLRILQQRFAIDDSEVVTFGDGGNDKEMLLQAGFGFAMANAPEKIRRLTRHQAGHCNEQGVLDIIDKILNAQPPFHLS